MEMNGGFLVTKIKQLGDRIFEKILSEKNIDAFNGAQGRILYVLWQEDGISIRSLSVKCGLAITSLTTMLEKMENQGLIRRVQSETDKRKTLLFLTEKAHSLKGEYDSVSDEMGSIYYKGFSEEEIARFEEMGFFRILHSVNDKNLLMAYHDEYLKNIEEYDEIHDTNYLETLHQYLLCNGSIQHVASNMFCHRNTITYRMRVIEDHWNLKLDDTVERFHLMVAFFIRDYLGRK